MMQWVLVFFLELESYGVVPLFHNTPLDVCAVVTLPEPNGYVRMKCLTDDGEIIHFSQPPRWMA